MEIITPEEVEIKKEDLRKRIFKGEIFIYPTDTIYGIGCNALNSSAVKKIREIKQRKETPFSVIAPSAQWVKENLEVTDEAKEWLTKLPGPYTLILKTKESPVAKEVAPGKDSLGIRVPKHWISDFVKFLDIPIITTSVNITDEPFMTKVDDLDMDINDSIRHKVSFVIDEGEITGRPSKLVHLEGEEVKIRER